MAVGKLLLVPIGPVVADLLPWLGEQLVEMFGRPWAIASEMSLPEEAYTAARRQYRSGALMARLQSLPAPEAWRVLGVVEADLYDSGLNFIFGQAVPFGRDALVALPRLRPSFYGPGRQDNARLMMLARSSLPSFVLDSLQLPPRGEAEGEAIFRGRLFKEAVHELGHTLGLPHCRDRRCVMDFSNSLEDSDLKGAAFCRRCARLVGAALG